MLNLTELLRIFCMVAESGSFKEAAVRLGKSPQAVTRAVQELERRRGEILFYRTTRQRRITRQGEILAQKSKLLLQEMDTLLNLNQDADDEKLSGTVTLTAPVVFGRKLLFPFIRDFMLVYPEIQVSLMLSDRHSDVIDEQIDIGVRTGFVRDNRFVARKIMDISFYLLGSPSLIHRTGVPADIDDLINFPSVALHDAASNRFWPWMFEQRNWFPRSPTFVTNDLDMYCEAIKNGLGLGQLPDFMARPYITAGLLVPVLRHIEAASWGLYLYRPQTGPVSRRTRVLFDFLSDRLNSVGQKNNA
ncbi:LysR family transcriptional regulator [Enterobacter sp. Acro-832]|uniref:LysR family transcriptional regulator n=1 Tax=Enterobacter sp. Acro-832 TaxID=2608348 RepID=UPI00141FB9F0|nr:LysR family transcriptional regulator [Enterobacter sp. Acro-832]NIG46435.1 LysR family transcriptional regulator [Enterobacter sp. Acro-832]